MTRSRAENDANAPTDMHVTYYTQRAGAGLIISEGSQVSSRAVGYINTAGIHSPEQVEGWKKVTEAVHKEGGKIFIQLWHVGRISHPKFHNGDKPLAPSAVNPNADVYTPDGQEKTVDPKAMSLPKILCREGLNLQPILFSGHTSLMASRTSKKNLALFGMLPPYSSVR